MNITENNNSIHPVTVTIDSLSHEGRGIARNQGKIIFVDHALPGETVRIHYTKKHRSRDEARVTEIIDSPSPDRIHPPCPHFEICGGCRLQHLAPHAQIEHKQAILLEQLNHFGHVEPETILSPLTGPTTQYRRRARLSVKWLNKKNKLLIGFHEKNGRYVADLDQCPILIDSVGEHFSELRTLISSLSLFDAIPQIEIASGDHRTALVIRHLRPFSSADIELLRSWAKALSFDLYGQSGAPSTIYPLYLQEGSLERLTYAFPAHHTTLAFHPNDFTQINADINRQLVDFVIDYLTLKPTDTLLDLFCGIGNFSIPIAHYVHSVTGIEGDQRLTDRATENALLNHIDSAIFHVADLTQSTAAFSWAKQKYDKILLDPPRTGALDVISSLPTFGKTSRIVYVSCNPATLARDLGILVHSKGYRLKVAGVMDMFPHTAHVESIALLELR